MFKSLLLHISKGSCLCAQGGHTNGHMGYELLVHMYDRQKERGEPFGDQTVDELYVYGIEKEV